MNYIDTGRVIEEVRFRCLWDPAEDSYKNKDAKNKAWEEIGKELCGENFNTALDKQIRQRWKSVRDNYFRTKGNMRNTPSGNAAKHKKYLFFEQMTFLDRTSENEVTDSLSDNQSSVSEDLTTRDTYEAVTSASNLSTPSQFQRQQENTENSNDTPRWNQKRRNKRKSDQSNFENELITLLNQNTSTSNLSPDDLSFFESLAPILNNLSAYQKLQFRSKVLGLVIEISPPTTSTPSFLSPPENNVNSSLNANSTYNCTTRSSPYPNYNYSTTSTPEQLYESAVAFSNVISPTEDNNSNSAHSSAAYSSIVESMNVMNETHNEDQ
ncbi:unnamed protein product [Parnassius mnemosyne]|uniref:MADF domain-containing protein n=1 Tax=Parnassius mnemosyne TaxID=213953 RepID=A0AAV1KXA9_9NEOP